MRPLLPWLAAVLMTQACCGLVHDHDFASLQDAVGRQPRIMLVLHDGECQPTHELTPWLYAMSERLPDLHMARVDLSNTTGSPSVAQLLNVDVERGSPQVKALVREAPPGSRVVDYVGPLSFNPLLKWATAVLHGTDNEHATPGYEPPVDEGKIARERERREKANRMSTLPKGVRQMAETMIKETRLKQVLDRAGKLDDYEADVAVAFKKLVAENSIEAGADSFKTQEANRIARDIVRERLLKTAPEYIRERVNADVNLGDGNARAGLAPANPFAGSVLGRGKDEL